MVGTNLRSPWQPRVALLRLPNELLVQIARCLANPALFHWILTCRFFHDLLVGLLYRNDVEDREPGVEPQGLYSELAIPSIAWGCAKGTLNTLRHALRAGANLNLRPQAALGLAIDGADPASTAAFLLDNGADPNGPDNQPHTWGLVARTIAASRKGPRWCPLPILELLLDHGGKLTPAPLTFHSKGGLCAMDQWRRVFSLDQVRGPRRRLGASVTDDGDFALRYDHCLHNEACAVAVTRLLLLHGADPNFRRSDDTVVTLAMRDSKRPVELLRCLADAGAHLDRGSAMSFSMEPGFQQMWWQRSVEDPVPLQLAVEDAVRIDSLLRHPRGRGWSVYPEVQCTRAGEVVRFLLGRGVPVDDRSRMLLDRWEPRWQKCYRKSKDRPESAANASQRQPAEPQGDMVVVKSPGGRYLLCPLLAIGDQAGAGC